MKFRKIFIAVLAVYFIMILTCFSSASSIVSNDLNEKIETDYSPEVFATSAILLDVDENKVLFEKNSTNIMYPASTTKLMTAILTVENCPDLMQKVNVSYYAVNSVPATYADANLLPGEHITINDLLNALLIPSANDAAYVLAQYVASKGNNYPIDSSESSKISFNNSISVFSEMMNTKAKELNCENTHFVNPNGIHNENHYSTAYDLMLIGKYVYQNSILHSICKNTKCILENTNLYKSEPRTFKTTNLLLTSNEKGFYTYANGLKTGFTDPAQMCIVASANKEDRNLIAVILHSEETKDENKSRESDCKRLFEYGFNYYSNAVLISKDSVVKSLNVFNGNKETRQLNVICADELKTLIAHNQIIDATPEIELTKTLAPIAKGEIVGTITYRVNDKILTSNLIAEHDVYSINYVFYIAIVAIIMLFLLIIYKRLFGKRKKRRKYNHR